jgi:hypothetical protein
MRSSFVCRSGLVTAFIFVGLLAALFGQIGNTHAQGSVIYVVPGGTGSQDGQSWGSAKDFQAALTVATSGQQLWVKAGTYAPTTAVDRNATFALKSGVTVYGGFAGAEDALSLRNVTTNVTTLSGEIGAAGTGDNSYMSSLVAASTSPPCSTALHHRQQCRRCRYAAFGGGVTISSGSPTLTNVTISGNWARHFGGGMYNTGSSPVLTNVTISSNSVSAHGGGMYNTGSKPGADQCHHLRQ